MALYLNFTKILAALITLASISTNAVGAQNVPSYSRAIRTFGDYTNWRPAPTSGTLTGTYRTSGNWVQTGPITCQACRLYFGGTVTINDAFTVSSGLEGNAAPTAAAITANYTGGGGFAQGKGPGAGFGWVKDSAGTSAPSSGGGHGGAGGAGQNNGSGQLPGGAAYTIDAPFLAGSSGGGPFTGGTSGAGGGGLYLEALGNISMTSATVMTAAGGAGVTFGAGGAGGGIDIRSMGNITVNSGASITAPGGASAGGAGAGGGGIIQLMPGPGKSSTTAGATITAAGGTASGGGSNGSVGTVTTAATFTGSRVGF